MLQVDDTQPQVSGARQNPEGAYTTEAPDGLKKAIGAQKATKQGSRDLWGALPGNICNVTPMNIAARLP